jgi:hypothetical protein
MRSQNFTLFALFALSPLCTAQQVLREHLGPVAELRFGEQICTLGDADGDGVADYAIAGDDASTLVSSELAVYSGRDGRRLWRYVHTGLGKFASSIAAAGDVDRDGLADLWVGVPARFSPEPGAVELRRGHDGLVLRRISTANQDSTGFGQCVAGLPDVNADGVPDLAVLLARIGRVELRSGATGLPIRWALPAGNTFDPDFSALENVGDCNGDGIDDVAYGNPVYSITGSGARDGQVRIYSGLTLTLIRAVNSPSGSAYFGRSLCGLSDLDGDGRAEIAIGAPDAMDPLRAVRSGAVFVYSPARDQFLYTRYPQAYSLGDYGGTVDRVGDLDEDGYADFAVASEINSGTEIVRVFSGLAGRELFELRTANPEIFGSAIAPCGDLDGDGRAEWLLGAAGHSGSAAFQGRVLVMNGTLFAVAESLGRGCSFGGAPEPRLSVAPRPALGTSIQLVNHSTAPAVILLGSEGLTPYRIGLSECYVQLDLVSIVVVGLLPASSAWALGVPLERSLLGRAIAFQGVIADPLGSSLGVIVTNGVALHFGW